MPTPGENVVVAGRFRLNHKLGQGGMGSVWHATQLGLDAPCAIKFIEGEFAQQPDMQARFEREAKAAAALRSPHVVQVIDHSTWEGLPFIAMELLLGEDLAHRIESRRTLTPEETLTILGQVCRALSKAHAIGIVHRDLKPENIFLVKDDDREIAKILDFGIAKNISLEVGSTTRTGTMMGTPFYMSPEQAQGTRSIDARSDLWAVAVIAYQCLTGELPFVSEALGDLLMKIMVAPPPVPSHVAPVPAGFDAWFSKATTRDPDGRFQSAKELMDALTTALGQSPPASASVPESPVVEPVPARMVSEARTHVHDGRESDLAPAGVPKRSGGALFAVIAGVFLVVGIGITVAVVKLGGAAAPDPYASAAAPASTPRAPSSTSSFAGTLTPPAGSVPAAPAQSTAHLIGSASSAPPSPGAMAIDSRRGFAMPAGSGARPKASAQAVATVSAAPVPSAAPTTAPAPTKDPHDLGF